VELRSCGVVELWSCEVIPFSAIGSGAGANCVGRSSCAIALPGAATFRGRPTAQEDRRTTISRGF
jgi:hypothetical protein